MKIYRPSLSYVLILHAKYVNILILHNKMTEYNNNNNNIN